MPFASDKQRKFLYIKKPDVARKFAQHGKSKKFYISAKMARRPAGVQVPGNDLAPSLAGLQGEDGKLESDSIGNKAPYTNEQFLAAMGHERGRNGNESDLSIAKRVKTHLSERPDYYSELARMVNPDHANLVGKMTAPKQLVSIDVASVDFAIRAERPLHCGNCAAFTGKMLTGKCSRVCAPGTKSSLLKVHYFNGCALHRPKNAGAPLTKAEGAGGGWEAGPRGGIRRRRGNKWQYMTEHHPDHAATSAAVHGTEAPAAEDTSGDMFDVAMRDALKKKGVDAIAAVRKKDPKLAIGMAASLGAMHRNRDNDPEAIANAKDFMRAFNQAAAPASVLGPDLAGLFAAGHDKDDTAEAKKAAEKGTDGVEKGWAGMIAPIGGSSPREETPPIPDYEDLYYQPKDSEAKQREAEQEAVRRRANAKRNTAVYGFHGAAGNNLGLEPEIRYEGDPNQMKQSVMGPTLAQRAPVIRAPEIDRVKAGSTYGEDGIVPGKTDHGRVPRTPDRRDDSTVPDVGGRPTPEDKGRDVGDDDEEGEGHIATYAELRAAGSPPDDDEDDDDDELRLTR